MFFLCKFLYFFDFFPLFTEKQGVFIPRVEKVFLIFYGNSGKCFVFSHFLRKIRDEDFFPFKKLFPIFCGNLGKCTYFFSYFTEIRGKNGLFPTFYGKSG